MVQFFTSDISIAVGIVPEGIQQGQFVTKCVSNVVVQMWDLERQLSYEGFEWINAPSGVTRVS